MHKFTRMGSATVRVVNLYQALPSGARLVPTTVPSHTRTRSRSGQTGRTRGGRDYSSCTVSQLCRISQHFRKGDVTLLFAIDISKWPGVNQAFLFSFVLAIAMTLVAIPYGKRRPIGTPFSWGEACSPRCTSSPSMFIAYGVVPDRWIQHADKNLGWTKQKLFAGPFGIFEAEGQRRLRSRSRSSTRSSATSSSSCIHVIFFGLQIWVWSGGRSAASRRPAPRSRPARTDARW